MLLLSFYESRGPQGTLLLFLQMISRPPSDVEITLAILTPTPSSPPWVSLIFPLRDKPLTTCLPLAWHEPNFCLHQQPYPNVSSSASTSPWEQLKAWASVWSLSPTHNLCMKRSPTFREEDRRIPSLSWGSHLGPRSLENPIPVKGIKWYSDLRPRTEDNVCLEILSAESMKPLLKGSKCRLRDMP